MPDNPIGYRFKATLDELIRLKKILNYSDFAKEIGKKPATISGIFGGDQKPTTEMLAHLYDKYDVNIGYIISDDENMFIVKRNKAASTPASSYSNQISHFKGVLDQQTRIAKAHAATFEDIVTRYKNDLTTPPMTNEEVMAYRTIVNSHSTPDILINALYRLDQLEKK